MIGRLPGTLAKFRGTWVGGHLPGTPWKIEGDLGLVQWSCGRFWLYRLDPLFGQEQRASVQHSLDKAFSMTNETLGRKDKEKWTRHAYKVINLCKYPCVCADMYGGMSNHTVWQWGRRHHTMLPGMDVGRPDPPEVLENVLFQVSRHLVDQVAGVPMPSDRQGLEKLSSSDPCLAASDFYVVGNKYVKDTCIGIHSDYSPLYQLGEQGQEAMVFSMNIKGDGVLWTCPTMNGQLKTGMANRSMSRIGGNAQNYGKLRYYLDLGMVLPVYAPEGSMIVMGGSFQREMVHWTHSHRELRQAYECVTKQIPDITLDENLLRLPDHPAVVEYLKSGKACPDERTVPQLVTVCRSQSSRSLLAHCQFKSVGF